MGDNVGASGERTALGRRLGSECDMAGKFGRRARKAASGLQLAPGGHFISMRVARKNWGVASRQSCGFDGHALAWHDRSAAGSTDGFTLLFALAVA